ncbi:MAG TPA: PQQ-binding-like beta-propeller repeat protein, partial [Dehalococcoidia bacterium]|nr:PQQ-binding-like beta-propeller repeat protein [Dehalococcoidia bacterium]
MKQQRRAAALLVAIAGLSLFVLSCGGAAGSRGWAAPVPVDNLELVDGSKVPGVLVSARKGHLVAINTQNREAIWRFPECWSISDKKARSLQGIYGAPIATRDGQTVFVGDYSGHVYAFPATEYNCGQGEKKAAASLKLDDHIIGGIALDQATDTIYVTSGPRLLSLSARDLTARMDNKDANVAVKEVFKAGGDIWGAPVLTPNGILVSSLDGNLYMLDAGNGRETWRFAAGKSLASTPVLSSGVVLVGGFDGRLHAVDIASGDERWEFKASHWVWSSPLVEGGRAYFGDFDGRLYAVDVSSGRELWSFDLGKGAIRAAPALSRDTLVVATERGWLVGVETSGQAKRWETKIGTGIDADVVVKNDSVYIAPRGCVTAEGSEDRIYYTNVDARTGELRLANG